MKINVIPNKEFIEMLDYCTKWYHQLKGGQFLINTRDSFRPVHRVGNFREWMLTTFRDSRKAPESILHEVCMLMDAYPSIEKLEFVGVHPEYITDLTCGLNIMGNAFRGVEVNRGAALKDFQIDPPQLDPPPLPPKRIMPTYGFGSI